MTTQCFWRRLLLPRLVLRAQDKKILDLQAQLARLQTQNETLYNRGRFFEMRLETQVRRNEEQHQLLMFDALTGALSLRGLHAEIEHLELTVKQMDSAIYVGLLAVDIDDFKPINDSRGHAAGDAVLRDLAQKILGSFRADARGHPLSDKLVRKGGDEFLILLPLQPEEALDEYQREFVIASRADQIRQLLDTRCAFGNDMIEYSCSVGHTVMMAGESFDVAHKRADEALYLDKTVRQQTREGKVVKLKKK